MSPATWSGYLTIVPQSSEHDPAVVIGTADALSDLAIALLRAGQGGRVSHTGVLDPGDGEGYQISVVPVLSPVLPFPAPVCPSYHLPRLLSSSDPSWLSWYRDEILPRLRAAAREQELNRRVE